MYTYAWALTMAERQPDVHTVTATRRVDGPLGEQDQGEEADQHHVGGDPGNRHALGNPRFTGVADVLAEADVDRQQPTDQGEHAQ